MAILDGTMEGFKIDEADQYKMAKESLAAEKQRATSQNDMLNKVATEGDKSWWDTMTDKYSTMTDNYNTDQKLRDDVYTGASSIGKAFGQQAGAERAGADYYLQAYGKKGLDLGNEMTAVDKIYRNDLVDRDRQIQSKLYDTLLKDYTANKKTKTA